MPYRLQDHQRWLLSKSENIATVLSQVIDKPGDHALHLDTPPETWEDAYQELAQKGEANHLFTISVRDKYHVELALNIEHCQQHILGYVEGWFDDFNNDTI